MTETVTIEVLADVKDAQDGMSELRDDLKKTQKASDKTKTSFGDISKSLGSISPQLGKVTQGVGKLTQSIKKLGMQTGSNGAFGQMSSKLGKLTSSSGFKKGVGIAGIALAGTALLSNILGNQDNKLAAFDKLNNIGQDSLLDFLTEKFKGVKNDLKPIAEATAATAASAAGLYALYKEANPELSGNENGAHSEESIKEIVDGLDKASDEVIRDNQNTNKEILDLDKKEKAEETKLNKKFWEQFREDGNLSLNSVQDVWASLKAMISEGITDTESAFNALIQSMKSGSSSTATPKTSSSSSSSSSAVTEDTVSKDTSKLAETVSSAWDTVKSWVSDGASAVKDAVSWVTDHVKIKRYASTSGESSSSGGSSSSSSTSWLDSPMEDWMDGIIGNGDFSQGTTNGQAISNSLEALSLLAGGSGGVVSKVASKVGSALGKVGDAIADAFSGIFKVPGFAEGGLFLPNQPQLAVLGDNKTEPEVAAPKSMIVEAVKEAMQSMTSGQLGLMSNQTEPIPITLELDGRTLARILYDPLNNETVRRNGVGLI